MDAEKATEMASGILIDRSLTAREVSLSPAANNLVSSSLVDSVYNLNCKAIKSTNMLVKFKTMLIENVLSCRLFTYNYPLLIEHIRREAIFFMELLGDHVLREANHYLSLLETFKDDI